MAKYQSDKLICMVFDEYGSKIVTESLDHQSLLKAYEESGPDLVRSVPGAASFAILRVLHNSIDRHSRERWLP